MSASRDPQNTPLYISTFNIADDDGFRLQSIVHSSLDVLDERGGRAGTLCHPRYLCIILMEYSDPSKLSLSFSAHVAVSLGLRTSPGAIPDHFLGQLASAEGQKVFGLVSNTRTRFLVSLNDPVVREEDVRRVKPATVVIFPFVMHGVELAVERDRTTTQAGPFILFTPLSCRS